MVEAAGVESGSLIFHETKVRQAFPLNSAIYKQYEEFAIRSIRALISANIEIFYTNLHQELSWGGHITNKESTHAILIAYRLFVFG